MSEEALPQADADGGSRGYLACIEWLAASAASAALAIPRGLRGADREHARHHRFKENLQ